MSRGSRHAVKNYINHVVFVIDESWSMTSHQRDVIRVVDNQIARLGRRSQELDQETRVSVYTFASDVENLIYDKDVLRLPSIAQLYAPRGNTALLDATIRGLDDLEKTAQLYGDHAFLVFVLTDGEENNSRATGAHLRRRLDALPAHWTVAVLVPNQYGKHEAQGFGFPPDNIAIWDANSVDGIESAGTMIERATDDFMVARSKGVRGTRTLFSTGADAVNAATVRTALAPVDSRLYDVLPVAHDAYIKPFVESHPRMTFSQGKCFYQLGSTKVVIQANKEVYIREKKTGTFYTGPAARDLIGLPHHEVKESGQFNPEYDIFIQSTSVNRKLLKGTDVLVLK